MGHHSQGNFAVADMFAIDHEKTAAYNNGAPGGCPDVYGVIEKEIAEADAPQQLDVMERGDGGGFGAGKGPVDPEAGKHVEQG